MAVARGVAQLVLSPPSTSGTAEYTGGPRLHDGRASMASHRRGSGPWGSDSSSLTKNVAVKRERKRTKVAPAGTLVTRAVMVRPSEGPLVPDAETVDLLSRLNSLLQRSPNLNVSDVLELAKGVQEADAPVADRGVGDEVWAEIRQEARRDSEEEPALASFLYSTILSHSSLERSLAFHLSNKLASSTLLASTLLSLISDVLKADLELQEAVRADLVAVRTRDPACRSYSQCLLNFKGFLACQAHRVSHRLWQQGRTGLALALQSRVSEVFQVDIHPGARLGKGLLLDHATGVVVGETAIIGDRVSILHGVTLGGSGITVGPRHPFICDGVLIGANATILGQVTVGEGAKIGAGSVVLTDVPPHCTAVGNPARLLGGKENPKKLIEVPSENMDQVSFADEWSGYVI